MRVKVDAANVSDLLYNAEQLYDDLKRAGLMDAASSVSEAVDDLRRKVREGDEG